jgi:nicotinate-nucleotide pyrophosphorylase (carboxylating)
LLALIAIEKNHGNLFGNMNHFKFLDNKIISLALAEDIGKKDLTGALIPKNLITHGIIVAQQSAVICGIKFVNKVFAKIDSDVKVRWFIKDGARVKKGVTICKIHGAARSILKGERVALNFLQTLSSTATLTSKYVAKLVGTNTILLDTRKTLPGLRQGQKYAVTCGGGKNHRFGLYDAVLIKENHIASCGSISDAVRKARRLYPDKFVEVEVKNLNELREALTTEADIIMLDNFTITDIRRAVKINGGSKKLEVSGGVNLNNIRSLAKAGVDYISVGAITKTAVPVELSLLLTPTP